MHIAVIAVFNIFLDLFQIALGSLGGQRELETAADMPLLAEALRREGFTEDEVEAIYWRNAYRFFKNNL